jgi:hypothetical protein
MNRGAAYELQLGNLQVRSSANILSNFEDSLVKLYKCLLDFLATALLVKEEKNRFSGLSTLCGHHKTSVHSVKTA